VNGFTLDERLKQAMKDPKMDAFIRIAAILQELPRDQAGVVIASVHKLLFGREVSE
jgi:hypothetical protein